MSKTPKKTTSEVPLTLERASVLINQLQLDLIALRERVYEQERYTGFSSFKAK